MAGLSQIRFSLQAGWHQMMTERVEGLPADTSSIILRFGLTDMNLRRDYTSLVVY